MMLETWQINLTRKSNLTSLPLHAQKMQVCIHIFQGLNSFIEVLRSLDCESLYLSGGEGNDILKANLVEVDIVIKW